MSAEQNPARNRRILSLIAEGKSYKEVATLLNINKNTVCGVVFRARRAGRPVTASPAKPNPKPKLVAVPPTVKGPKGEGCKWIEGDPVRNPDYCDAPRIPLTAWCPHHYSRVYRPAKPDEVAA